MFRALTQSNIGDIHERSQPAKTNRITPFSPLMDPIVFRAADTKDGIKKNQHSRTIVPRRTFEKGRDTRSNPRLTCDEPKSPCMEVRPQAKS
jgi:hypothetical protein